MGMLDDLDRMGKEYNQGDRNFYDLVVGMANRGIAQPIGELTSAVVPDFIEEPLSQGAQYLAEKSGLLEALQKADPVTRRRIEETLGTAGIIPTMRFGAAAASKAGQAVLPQRIGSDTTGMNRSSGDVFIEGYYGSPADKLKGLARFGADGMYQVAMNILDPRRAAMYRDYGITPQMKKYARNIESAKADMDSFAAGDVEKFRRMKAQETYQKTNKKKSFDEYYNEVKDSKDFTDDMVGQYVDRRYRNQLELFQSQLQANAHIRQQAGAGGSAGVRDIPSEAAQIASAKEGTTYFRADDFDGNWMNKAANFDIKKPAKSVIPKPRADKFQEIITNTWEKAAGIDVSKANLYVKRPAGKYTGDHNRDIAMNQSVVTNIRRVFDAEGDIAPFDNKKELLDELNRENEYNIKAKNKGVFNIIDEDDDGYFVQFSFAGSAKTEGGVNAITHVNKNGTLTTVISDVHDMAVGGPLKPIGKYLDYSMQDELTVTPPMVHNLVTKKNINTGNAIKKEDIEAFQEDVKSLRPTTATMADEVSKRVGAGMFATSFGQEEEQ